MAAHRAHIRSLWSDINMSAVAAHPDLFAVLGEDFAFFEIFEKLAVALLMGFCGEKVD